MMQWGLLAFALIAGVLNTVQTGANTQLNKALGAPALALAVLVTGARWQDAGWSQVPWRGWIGGVLGASYILANLLVADKVGAALFMGVTVTAAVVTSLVMDHFGLLGFEVKPAGAGRLFGGAMMIGGLLFIARS
jgi:transporter family-2 protein